MGRVWELPTDVTFDNGRILFSAYLCNPLKKRNKK